MHYWEWAGKKKQAGGESETQKREANDRRWSVHELPRCSTEARPHKNGIACVSSRNCPWEGQESWGVYPSISNRDHQIPATRGLPWALTESSDREAERCGCLQEGAVHVHRGCLCSFGGSSEVDQGDEGIGSIPYTTCAIRGQFPFKKTGRDNTVLCVHNTITSWALKKPTSHRLPCS